MVAYLMNCTLKVKEKSGLQKGQVLNSNAVRVSVRALILVKQVVFSFRKDCILLDRDAHDSCTVKEMKPDSEKKAATPRPTWRQQLKAFYLKAKSLQGDPHYVAMGMAIGVFVAVTPTIPFHTVIAVAIAFLLKASKPAAFISVWFSNPLTIPLFYYGSYKVGMLLLGYQVALQGQHPTVQEMLKMGLDVTIAMIVGGAVLGIVPAVITYVVTFHIFRKIRARREKRKSQK